MRTNGKKLYLTITDDALAKAVRIASIEESQSPTALAQVLIREGLQRLGYVAMDTPKETHETESTEAAITARLREVLGGKPTQEGTVEQHGNDSH